MTGNINRISNDLLNNPDRRAWHPASLIGLRKKDVVKRAWRKRLFRHLYEAQVHWAVSIVRSCESSDSSRPPFKRIDLSERRHFDGC